MLSNRILTNIRNVPQVVSYIANAMIRKTLLPNFHIRSQLLLRPIREPALDELDSLLQTRFRRDQNMDVIRHDDKFMQKICRTSVMIERVNHEQRPTILGEKSSPFTCG